MSKLIETPRASEAVTLTPTSRVRIVRTPLAVVLLVDRRRSVESELWTATDRPLAVPLDHIGEFVAAVEAAGREPAA